MVRKRLRILTLGCALFAGTACDKLLPDTLGDGGVAPDAGARDAAPVAKRYDLTIRGVGLGAFERLDVLTIVGDPAKAGSERVLRGRATIRDGGFRIVLDDALEADVPKSKIVVLDIDGDGRCTGGEPFYFNGYAAISDASIDLGPASFGGAVNPEACDALFP